MKSSRYFPELDGVRGFAIIMVVAYHAFRYTISPTLFIDATNLPGWSVSRLASYCFAWGVDIFFVLAGFLITRSLLNAEGQPGYLRKFYMRRIRRVWPLYAVFLLVSYGFIPLLILRTHVYVEDLAYLASRNIVVFAFMLQNLWYAEKVGVGFLGMTYSLAITGQFCMVWPWVVSWCNRKKLASILVALIVVSPLLRLWARTHGVSPDAIYFLTWSRLDGLCLGALLAVYCSSSYFSLHRTKLVAVTAMAIGLPSSIWLMCSPSDLTSTSPVFWPIRYSMLALASAGVVLFAIWCSQTQSVYGSPFRAGWLRYMGQVSYCMLLIHEPVYYYLSGKKLVNHIGTSPGAGMLVIVFGFAVTFGIAALSWHLFESRMWRREISKAQPLQGNSRLPQAPARLELRTQ